jgi:hypothetical protein
MQVAGARSRGTFTLRRARALTDETPIPDGDDLPMKRLDLRPVLHWLDAAQFSMGEQVLREADIPCESHGTALNDFGDPFSATALDLRLLRVRAEDLERARELLRETVGRGVIDGEG